MILGILLSLIFPFLCHATDLKPWFGAQYETEVRAVFLYQNYDKVAIPGHHDYKRCENDLFATLSATYPFKRYCGEFEATLADTRHQNKLWDNFRLTGRYQWLNDREGDSMSLVTGITLTQPLTRALHDISSFHHGHIEGEFHVAIGETYGDPDYDSHLFRWWTVSGVGVAQSGSAWVRGDAACRI